MSGRVVFLLEEPSMKAFLSAFLPRLIPGWREGEHFLLVPHEGKSDLEKSIPRKLKAWREPGTRFVIVRDNDRADCAALKARLLGLCQNTPRRVLVRLVCQELEAWYLAQPNALADAYPARAKAITNLANRHRDDPDGCPKPSRELTRVIPEFQKHSAARQLGQRLDPNDTRSASFRVFVTGVQQLVASKGGVFQ
ncbi:MAG: Uncharacterized protein JG774_1017 [Desulfomicrobiaceae bacterium]|jgi:hypothetical protein|nr:Uncharacterized protein [Desulfomicrobiaceae bacterium]MDI3493777.1 hypothetical protein [Desulfomicrobiaceae bacterium]HCF05839.1 cytoplasmic protein [Desulfomicrobiaceae bacterium]